MKSILLSIITLLATTVHAEKAEVEVQSLDQALKLSVQTSDGQASYSITYNDKIILKDSPLGFRANIGDFSKDIHFVYKKEGKFLGHSEADIEINKVHDEYNLDRIKKSSVSHDAIDMLVHMTAGDKRFDVRFHVTNNDVAFRYELPKYGETASIRIMEETTGFCFPDKTTTFICPQSDAMIGWKRTKPSYEEDYVLDAPMDTKSRFGHGYTFPCLFRVGDDGWALVSETGVDSRYCGSHLSDYKGNGLYNIAFPMPEENNGNGTIEPAFSLPGATPWRTITVGSTLEPIMETTIAYDVVKPLYESANTYKYGKGTWSWILWQDESINYNDQAKFVDLSAAMGFQYVLVDNWWDTKMGKDEIEKLVKYAHTKGIEVFLWYSSSGYWNDIEQGPINMMDNSIIRKQQMKWMKRIGVKGVKIDFFGGDKQETIRLYEQILSDADDNGLMVIFHGCTLPRGWERMYPNYVGSEAVLASENLIFSQGFCDNEAVNATLHPFIRNTVGCMEYGGSPLNKRFHRSNAAGNYRRTTDIFEIATSVMFQNPIQNFALAPNNLDDAPQICLDFLRNVPTTWDDLKFIDGYPGQYVAMARRKGDTWYVACVNAKKEPLNIELDLSSIFTDKDKVTFYNDDKNLSPQKSELTIKKAKKVRLTIAPNGGIVIVK